MPEYLDEPSQDEAEFFQSRQGETYAKEDPAEDAPAEQEAAEKEPKQEATEDLEADGKENDDDQPKVNLGALHEARAQNRELRGELTKARETMARMEARFDDIVRRIEGQSRTELQDKPGPSYEDDPEGYYRHQIEELKREIGDLKITDQKTKEQEDQNRQYQDFVSHYRAAAAEYGRKQTDFTAAYEWLTADVDAELQMRGYNDPAQRQQIMSQEEARMAALAFSAGANPAQRLYELAKRRGYKADETQVDKIVNIEKAKSKAKSLSNAGGGTDAALTLETLASLDGPEFDAAWQKLARQGKLG